MLLQEGSGDACCFPPALLFLLPMDDAMSSPFNTPSLEAYEAAALRLAVEARAVRAVARVESGRNGAFLANGEPVLLFERHIFSKLTDGKFDGAVCSPLRWGLISSPTPSGPGEYGPLSQQHRRMRAAAHFNEEAALKSASWGLFQLMGFNHGRCGFPTVFEFVRAMREDVDRHLLAFVSFLSGDSRLVEALRKHDWKTFALLYNGAAQHGYDSRLEAAYKELA